MSSLRRGLPAPATAGVRVPADKHFRRPDERPGRRRRSSALLTRVVVFGLAFVAVVATGTWAIERVIQSSMFAVRSIVVRGNSRLSARDIEALVDDVRHESILRVDLERYRRRLLDCPWVATAAVWRVLPSTVEIQITERVPMALARQEELLYLVDDLGTIIDEFGPQYRALDLPVVDGLLPAPGGTGSVDVARLRIATDFLAAIGAAPEFKSRVSEADVTDAHDVVVMLDDDPVALHLGDQQFVERLKRYAQLAPSLRDRFKAVASVDLRFDDRLVVRPAGAPGAAGAAVASSAAAREKGR